MIQEWYLYTYITPNIVKTDKIYNKEITTIIHNIIPGYAQTIHTSVSGNILRVFGWKFSGVAFTLIINLPLWR